MQPIFALLKLLKLQKKFICIKWACRNQIINQVKFSYKVVLIKVRLLSLVTIHRFITKIGKINIPRIKQKGNYKSYKWESSNPDHPKRLSLKMNWITIMMIILWLKELTNKSIIITIIIFLMMN